LPSGSCIVMKPDSIVALSSSRAYGRRGRPQRAQSCLLARLAWQGAAEHTLGELEVGGFDRRQSTQLGQIAMMCWAPALISARTNRSSTGGWLVGPGHEAAGAGPQVHNRPPAACSGTCSTVASGSSGSTLSTAARIVAFRVLASQAAPAAA